MRAVVRIPNALGLHARPISEFVRTVGRFRARVVVRGPGGEADGGSVLQMMGLAAPRDAELEITASGSDAREVVEALCGLVEAGFGEH